MNTTLVKISAKSARELFQGCDPNYIRDVCHGRCCWANNTGKETHSIPVFPEEEESLRAHGAKIENGFMVPANGGDRCQFQGIDGLCSLHADNAKPLTCWLSPFVFNDSGTLVVKNRNRLLKCYQDETVAKTPAYVAYRNSLVKIFGETAAEWICSTLDTGSGDFSVPIDTERYKKIQQLRKAHKGVWEPWVPRAQAVAPENPEDGPLFASLRSVSSLPQLPFTTQIVTLPGGNIIEAVIVRDDLLEGGTKTRFLPGLIGDHKEIVFGGPFPSGTAVALAAVGRRLGRKITLFYAQRAVPHPRQALAASWGAELHWVPYGYSTNVQAKARDYAAKAGALFLPLGYDFSAVEAPLVDQISQAFAGQAFDEVWCATGSGMLARVLGLAFPASRVYAVTVGLVSKHSKLPQPQNVTLLGCGYRYEKPCKATTPFPACPHYEKKAWEVCIAQGRGRILFWNVIGS
jgi:hypothetical protein